MEIGIAAVSSVEIVVAFAKKIRIVKLQRPHPCYCRKNASWVIIGWMKTVRVKGKEWKLSQI